jgi:hypothetical protein
VVAVRVSIVHTAGRRQHVVTVTGEVRRLRVIGRQPPILAVFEAAGLAELLEPDRRSSPRR